MPIASSMLRCCRNTTLTWLEATRHQQYNSTFWSLSCFVHRIHVAICTFCIFWTFQEAVKMNYTILQHSLQKGGVCWATVEALLVTWVAVSTTVIINAVCSWRIVIELKHSSCVRKLPDISRLNFQHSIREDKDVAITAVSRSSRAGILIRNKYVLSLFCSS